MALLFLIVTFIAYYKRILAAISTMVAAINNIIIELSDCIQSAGYYRERDLVLSLCFLHDSFRLCSIYASLWYVVRLIYPRVALFVVVGIFRSVSLGIFQQVSAYTNFVSLYTEKQDYRDIFDFLIIRPRKIVLF